MAHVAPGMWLRARDTLHRICDMAEEEGVTFTLENLNLREHPGCPFNSTVDVLSLVAAVDRPQLRINLDLYHTQIGEGDVIRHAKACQPWIGEVQVADNPGRCEPGTGEMNWPMIARALADMGYDRPVGMEAFAKTSRKMLWKPSARHSLYSPLFGKTHTMNKVGLLAALLEYTPLSSTRFRTAHWPRFRTTSRRTLKN